MLRAGIETGAWWLVTTALWLVTAAPPSGPEIVIAVLAGLPCGLAAAAARRAAGTAWRPRAAWLRWLPPLAVAVPADTARALYAVVRRRRLPGIRRLGLPPEPEDAVAAARRALVTVVLSSSPGSYAVHVAPDDGGGDRAVLHVLTDGRPRMSEVVGR